MASSIQLLRSTNPQERPFAGNLLEGQPAANLHSSEPGLFFKTTDGSVVKFGPAAITSDGSPPNSTPQGSAGNSVGELWLDKSVDPAVLKVYDGSAWIDAGSGGGGGGAGAFVRWIYVAAGGETSLSGSSNGVLLDYTPGLEDVYVNGVLITRGIDYSATNGSSITNLVALAAGDVVTVASINPINTVQLPGQVTLLRWSILATSGQTILSGVDSSSQQLTYAAGFEEVYINGAFLRRGVDYIATDGSTITGLSPLTEDDEVTVMAWSPFEVGDSSVPASNILFSRTDSSYERTLQSKLEEYVDVTDFGVVGNGTVDDTTNFQTALDTGLPIFVPSGLSIKISRRLVSTSKIFSFGDSTILGFVLDSATHPYVLRAGGDVQGLRFDGTNCATGVGGIEADSSNITVDGCVFENFDSDAFFSKGGLSFNSILNCRMNNCGRYPDKHVIYLHNDSRAVGNTILNSKYKAIISGTASTRVRVESNFIDTTTGAASDAIYFSPFSTDCVAINNVVKNAAGWSLKASSSTQRNVIQNNLFYGGVFSQGGTDNEIVSNRIYSSIVICAHTTVPDTRCKVIGNVCGGISLCKEDLRDTEGLQIKNNTVFGNISGAGTCPRNLRIEQNTVEGSISLTFAESFLSPGQKPGPVFVIGNAVKASSTSNGIVLVGSMYTNGETSLVVCSGNTVQGGGSSQGGTGIRLVGNTKNVCENNDISEFAIGTLIHRIRHLRFSNNIAIEDVSLGFSFPEISSATYWPGSDFVIQNNLGTRDESNHTTLRRARYYLTGKDLYASGPPSVGYYIAGEYFLNNSPAPGGEWGWVCTASGNPGVWKTFGQIQS